MSNIGQMDARCLMEGSAVRTHGPGSMGTTGSLQPYVWNEPLLDSGYIGSLDRTSHYLRTDEPHVIVKPDPSDSGPHNLLDFRTRLSGMEVRDSTSESSDDSAVSSRLGDTSCQISRTIIPTHRRETIKSPNPRISHKESEHMGHLKQTQFKEPTSREPRCPPQTPETKLLEQPATKPITEQQLINEVRGIYAGLVMVERKCVDIVSQQCQSTEKLSDEQWKALVALHRTLLQEHHDFFSASQHPTASDNLKKLATKYAMPARMWRHGIHAFLELLRHRLPGSMEHMLSFIYLAYSMMALLKESVPNFTETWIECLGDLARYRMAIEDSDPRDREVWSNVARMWYNEAADKSPNVGRLQHHLVVLARPNIVQQLFYYDKALVSAIPFINARKSIMLLFNMYCRQSDGADSRYPVAEYAFVNSFATLFTRRSTKESTKTLELFQSSFGRHLEQANCRFKMQGPQMALALFGLLDFGKKDGHFWHPDYLRQDYWRGLINSTVERLPDSSESVIATSSILTYNRITDHVRQLEDRNIVPFMHVFLAHLYSLSFMPGALGYIEQSIPWDTLVIFLNTLGRSGVSYPFVNNDEFPPSHGGSRRQLPEDFLMRGMMSTRHYYEPDFFSGSLVDEDERGESTRKHNHRPEAKPLYWLEMIFMMGWLYMKSLYLLLLPQNKMKLTGSCMPLFC